ASWQRCAECSAELGELESRTSCAVCGGLLEVLHRAPAEGGASLRALFDGRASHGRGADHSGVWRFRELVLPDAGASIVSHPEGNTPLVRREAVAQWAGVDELWLKHEGHNPTGSFKDRGMTVGVTQAKRLGAT